MLRGADLQKVLYVTRYTNHVGKCMVMRWAGHVARIGEERGVYRETGAKETNGKT